MAGWIKTYRDLANHWLAQDLEKLGWWIMLLLKVNYEDKKVLAGTRLIELKSGQIIASLSFLAGLWKTSKRTAERFIELLEQEQMVSRCTSQKVTILTICNWDSYQEAAASKRADTRANREPIVSQSVAENKKEEERKEIYNLSSGAHVREGIVPWVAETEQGYVQTFVAQGSALPFSKKVGVKAQDVMRLLDVYMATRELKNKGHKDFNEFINLFLWHVENKKIAIPVEAEKPKEKKVITGQDIFKVYG